MGLITGLIELLFGGGRNVVKETAEVFRENAEAGAQRSVGMQQATLAQFGAEFGGQKAGFDRVMDGINRIPRPALALGTLALFVAAMVDPVWFSERMQGLGLVPEPLWWLLGVIVSFYFGARHQMKAQDFQRDIAQTMARTPDVVSNLETLRELKPESPGVARTEPDAQLTLSTTGAGISVLDPDAAAEPVAKNAAGGSDNPALDHWKAQRKAS